MQSLWRPRVAGLVAATGMVAALIVAPPAAAAPVLVSQGKPATASSVENPAQGAAKAFDGDNTTRWGSNFA